MIGDGLCVGLGLVGLLLFGVFVGSNVGLWEGPVGEKVGNSDGSNEGCPVGLLVLHVGVAVRKTVGIGVGCDDGSLVGTDVGIGVGFDDGSPN